MKVLEEQQQQTTNLTIVFVNKTLFVHNFSDKLFIKARTKSFWLFAIDMAKKTCINIRTILQVQFTGNIFSRHWVSSNYCVNKITKSTSLIGG